MYIDRLPARQSARAQPPAVRAFYVVDGALRAHAGAAAASLAANSAWFSTTELQMSSGSFAATVLRWELVARGAPAAPLIGPDIGSELALAAPVSFPRPGEYLLRGDRVDFPPGGEALPHTHQGPGIRCLLFGAIRIETGGTAHEYAPLRPWFEAGPQTVYAAASAHEATAFARVMILPAALRGQSSILYVRPEDASRPKSQAYQVFLDEPIALPAAP